MVDDRGTVDAYGLRARSAGNDQPIRVVNGHNGAVVALDAARVSLIIPGVGDEEQLVVLVPGFAVVVADEAEYSARRRPPAIGEEHASIGELDGVARMLSRLGNPHRVGPVSAVVVGMGLRQRAFPVGAGHRKEVTVAQVAQTGLVVATVGDEVGCAPGPPIVIIMKRCVGSGR